MVQVVVPPGSRSMARNICASKPIGGLGGVDTARIIKRAREHSYDVL